MFNFIEPVKIFEVVTGNSSRVSVLMHQEKGVNNEHEKRDCVEFLFEQQQ